MTIHIADLSRDELIKTIFNIKGTADFETATIAVFKYQYQNCKVYKTFCDALNCNVSNVTKFEEIPFMPVDIFRGHKVYCSSKPPELCFHSSTTTGSIPSRHFVADSEIYDISIERCFKLFFGNPQKYCFLALLPGYLERENASLVYMAKRLMEFSANENSGFYLYEHKKLKNVIEKLTDAGEQIILIGVSHALLNFAEKHSFNLKNTIVMETGGMKGQRKEIIRQDLHERLKKAFDLSEIASEYGMTELLSQAYAAGSGKFKTPPWMKVFIKEINDPFANVLTGQTGTINIIDLANVHSCSFIATQDLGKENPDSTFEVLGRLDNSEMRGCNLMIS